MDRLIATGTVAFGAHDVAPATGTPGMATDGNPVTGTPPTTWPAWACNMLSEEQRNIVLAAGLTPDRNNWGQLLVALRLLFSPQISYNSPDYGIILWPDSGVLRRVFTANPPCGGGTQTTILNLPLAFPNVCFDADICFYGSTPPSATCNIAVTPLNRAQVQVTTVCSVTGNPGVSIECWGN